MNLALCCISNVLAADKIKFRTMTFKSFSSKPKEESLEKLSEIVRNNFSVTEKIIRHCAANKIKGYRISSDLTPVINHPEVNMFLEELPNFKLIQYEINKIKTAIKETNVRVSAHPSEYITLTSDDPAAIKNSIRDLESHADLFDRLDISRSYYNPLNIHCRKDGEPNEISYKFMKNFELLSDSVRSRLVLENNDNAKGVWSIENLYNYFNQYNIPITFDILHHSILPGSLSEEGAFNLAYSTWDCVPLFHYSEGKDGTRAHKDMADSLPPKYNNDVYWDVELKGKDVAILEMLKGEVQ